MKRICFFYVAEAYQCYHSASVAFELNARPDVDVTIVYNDPDTPRHAERLRSALNAPPIRCQSVRRSLLTKTLRLDRRFGLSKRLIMRENARQLRGYDAVVAVENSAAALRHLGLEPTKLVYMPHGSGDRARSFLPRIAEFDLVLPSGRKNAERMLQRGLIRPGAYALTGYVKLEAVAAMRRASAPQFGKQRPTLLYNPHAMSDLNSWDRFAAPLIDAVSESNAFNLIVAPHIKLFSRRPLREVSAWEARACDNVIVDLRSEHLLDMSYALAADIYVGDVSSQVYEFLSVPRPCVFLNAHGVAWRDDPHFSNWRLGEVVDDPAQLMPALRRAQERHGEFRALQVSATEDALGDVTPGASRRAANAIIEFLERGSVGVRT